MEEGTIYSKEDYETQVKTNVDTQAVIDQVVAYITSHNFKDFPTVVALVEDATDKLGFATGAKDKAEAAAAESAGDVVRQEEAARRSVEAGRRLGSASLEARARLALGSALRSQGAIDRAVTEIDSARRLMATIGNRDGVAKARYALALAHASRIFLVVLAPVTAILAWRR